MKLTLKKLAMIAICSAGLSFVHAEDTNKPSDTPISQLETQFSKLQGQIINKNNPKGFQQFRMDYAEMQDLANPNRLAWRIFYDKPSKGPNAVWFDAVKQGNLEAVKAMVNAGVDIEIKDEESLGQTALGWAAFIGYEDMVDYLIDQGADLWATDRGDVYNVLKSATLGKNINVFKKLYEKLKDKTDINDQKSDMQGETMLIVAASNNRIDIVKYLLELGANPNIVTTETDTKSPAYDQDALTISCERGLTDMVDLLIKNGAINHRTGKASCDAK